MMKMMPTRDARSSNSALQLPVCLLLVLLLVAGTSAFTAPTSATTSATKNSQFEFALGPVARNGLGYEDEILGNGRRVLPGDTVYCYYEGSFRKAAAAAPANNGNPFAALMGGGGGAAKQSSQKAVFDAVTPADGDPFSFAVGRGQVIEGMDLGILGFDEEIPPMLVGGKRLLTIPAALAYGDAEMGPIPANQDLEFLLEIMDAGNENKVGDSKRVFGYLAAAGVPVVLLLAGFTVVNGNL